MPYSASAKAQKGLEPLRTVDDANSKPSSKKQTNKKTQNAIKSDFWLRSHWWMLLCFIFVLIHFVFSPSSTFLTCRCAETIIVLAVLSGPVHLRQKRNSLALLQIPGIITVDINRKRLKPAFFCLFNCPSVHACTGIAGLVNRTSTACNKGLQVHVCMNNGSNCVGGLFCVCVSAVYPT